ncbi:cyanophycinase [Xanthovirga aplysinae]|uniref:cyanophycinase n=1 Tax=Xanthovirga aplysinae TaxID=2529853 RepID=UPI0012BC9FCB|nr:cyanophycinase [Xanthovirga aplysinae]MTI29918.1 cyanophycinase [Xanthovirga aplysinae]
MKSILKFCFFAVFLILNAPSYSFFSENEQPVVGPKKGSLVIVGGNMKSKKIISRFIELAGGKDAPIVVLPTLMKDGQKKDKYAEQLKAHGATNVTFLYTTDRELANSEEFVEPLKHAKGVFFGGGRQWRFVDNYQGTKVQKLVREVLDRGGVIGGTSAGASIQGDYLARGDTYGNEKIMGDHQVGFGYLKNVAIDQHVLARNRQFEMINLLEKHPQYLGIGIDENTAIVVIGDQFEVIGESYVLMYDQGSLWPKKVKKSKNLPKDKNLFYFLRAGDKYNLKERKVIK